MRSAICISGLARTYRKTHESFMRNVVEPLKERGKVDTFISIWDTVDLASLSPRAAQEEKVDVNDIIRLYCPAAIEVESFTLLRDAFKLEHLVGGGVYDRHVVKDGVLTAAPAQYKTLKCNDLKRIHEQMKGVTYDLVVRTRFDFEISPLRVDEMDLSKVNCLYDHGDKVGDYFYIANSEKMNILVQLFVNYPTLLSIKDSDMGPERNLKNHMVNNGLESHILEGYTFALVRDTFKQEFRWKASVLGYEPFTSMIICSGLYYTGSLARGDLTVREGRFHPCKYSETFLPWYQYLRKHYPTDHLVLFCDKASPIPIQPLLDALPEPYDTFTGHILPIKLNNEGPLIHVKWVSEYAGKYFWPMQRNLVEGLLTAYHSGESILWIDNDCFLNTDVRPQVRDADVMSVNVAHHQQTMDSFCFYISSKRLHALEEIGADISSYFQTLLKNAPFNTRMHSIHEGGLYKTFWYGDARVMPNVNLSHLACYPRLMCFLKDNPLDTPEYRALVGVLGLLDLTQMSKEAISFSDSLYSEKEGLIPWK